MSTELYKDMWGLKQKHLVLCPHFKTISINYFGVSDECKEFLITLFYLLFYTYDDFKWEKPILKISVYQFGVLRMDSL